jgi:hypothetical protein
VATNLSSIPIPKRRQLAATFGLFATLSLTMGLVAASGGSSGVIIAFSVLTICFAVLLALMAWGVLHSVTIDLREQRLDEAIEATIRENGLAGQMCSCGHEHDPTELHITDACEHDGSGAACAHDCDTCVLKSLRPSPSQTRAERLA